MRIIVEDYLAFLAESSRVNPEAVLGFGKVELLAAARVFPADASSTGSRIADEEMTRAAWSLGELAVTLAVPFVLDMSRNTIANQLTAEILAPRLTPGQGGVHFTSRSQHGILRQFIRMRSQPLALITRSTSEFLVAHIRRRMVIWEQFRT